MKTILETHQLILTRAPEGFKGETVTLGDYEHFLNFLKGMSLEHLADLYNSNQTEELYLMHSSMMGIYALLSIYFLHLGYDNFMEYMPISPVLLITGIAMAVASYKQLQKSLGYHAVGIAITDDLSTHRNLKTDQPYSITWK